MVHILSRLAASRVLMIAAALTVPNLAQAQPIRTERNISLELANQMVAAAMTACQTGGHSVTATVVDRAGIVRAVQRSDNAGMHTLVSAERKAWTAASTKVSTLVIAEAILKDPARANLIHIPGFLIIGGGVPIRSGNEVIGAIGVAGAPGGNLDDQCANSALEKFKDQLK